MSAASFPVEASAPVEASVVDGASVTVVELPPVDEEAVGAAVLARHPPEAASAETPAVATMVAAASRKC